MGDSSTVTEYIATEVTLPVDEVNTGSDNDEDDGSSSGSGSSSNGEGDQVIYHETDPAGTSNE